MAFTSNVDGHFQKAGIAADAVVECHGSIHHLQCAGPCSDAIWPADGEEIRIDGRMRALDPLPRCRRCGGLARPNILMFGDANWVADRTAVQEARYESWLEGLRGDGCRLTIVECGAGTGVPTVRRQSEWIADRFGATLVRINLREPQGPAGTIGVPLGALEALSETDRLVNAGSSEAR